MSKEDYLRKAEAAKSSHEKAWWYGKALQFLHSPSSAAQTSAEELNDLYENNYLPYATKKESFLSPGAAELVVFDQSNVLKEITENESKWKIEDFVDLEKGSLKWENFTLAYIKALDQIGTEKEEEKEEREKNAEVSTKEQEKEKEQKKDDGKQPQQSQQEQQALLGTREEFVAAAKYLQRVSWVVHQWLISLGSEKFHQIYQDKFSILFREKSITEIYDILLCGGQRNFLAFHLITSSFERVLSDIFCAKTRKEHLCPNKLSELLVHKEIIKVLGIEKIFLLRALVGPLEALNLRNVVWHGFLLLPEYSLSWTSLLLVLLLSLKELVVQFNYKPRPLYELTAQRYPCFLQYSSLSLFSDKEDEKKVRDLFDRSFFTLPSQMDLWHEIISLFLEGRYHYCLTLLFPQLEHCCRRVFAMANECEERLLTAETDVLYTTLDILLFPTMDPGGKGPVNKIFTALGRQLLNALLDLLIWEKSPRVRDQIAHGAVDPTTMDKDFASFVMATMIYGCIRHDPFAPSLSSSTVEMDEYVKSLKCATISTSFSFIDAYQPLFHPKSFFEDKMKEALASWMKLKDFVDNMTIMFEGGYKSNFRQEPENEGKSKGGGEEKNEKIEAKKDAEEAKNEGNDGKNDEKHEKIEAKTDTEGKVEAESKNEGEKEPKKEEGAEEGKVVAIEKEEEEEEEEKKKEGGAKQQKAKPAKKDTFPIAILTAEALDLAKQLHDAIRKKCKDKYLFTRQLHLFDHDAEEEKEKENSYVRPSIEAFASVKDVAKVDVLTNLAELINSFIIEVMKRYDELHEKVVNRTAWKRHRENFGQLEGSMKFILAMSYILLISADEKYYDAADMTNELPLLSKNCAGKVLSHASGNQWKRVVEVFSAWAALKSYSCCALSVKEAAKLNCNIAKYLSSLLEQQK